MIRKKSKEDNVKKDFLPIILGSDENAYGNVRLIREKYNVRPLILAKRLLIPTRYSNLFDYRLIEDFDKDEMFVNGLSGILDEYENEYEKFVVIPCSDYYTALMVRHYDEFGGRIANRFISEEMFLSLETKDKFYALCEKHSLLYPATVVVEYEERENALPFTFEYPIIVKPENSNATEYLECHFDRKKKVYFINSDEEYIATVRALTKAGYKGKLIVQEFISGDDSAMRTVNCYSSNDGRLVFSCLGQPLLEEYAPYTLGNYAAIISRGEESLYLVIKEFLEAIEYRGFSNFDIKYDEKRGKYFFFEINPRTGRSSYFVRAAGYNLMEAMIEDSVYKNAPKNPVFSYNEALWSNVPMPIIKKYVKNKALREEALSKKKECTYTLFCKGDMNLKRIYRITRFYMTHFKNYKRYYFDKSDGKDT